VWREIVLFSPLLIFHVFVHATHGMDTKQKTLSHKTEWAEWISKLKSKPQLCDVVLVAKDTEGNTLEVPAVRALLALGSEVCYCCMSWFVDVHHEGV
jgi:hypothetical protein